jgi:antagonist of KipI
VPLFDPAQEPPTPMVAGDTVRFVAVSREEYDRLDREYWGAASREPRADSREGVEPRAASREPSVKTGSLAARQALEVLRAGLLTTVQDRGRFGSQQFGVTVSGAMDELALRVGNILVGNPQGAAGLEISLLGPQVRLVTDVVVAVTGAEMEADLDGEPVPGYQAILARAGQTLDIRHCRQGMRAYLCVGGGIEVPLRLGSRSTSLAAEFGGMDGRPLRDGDTVRVGPTLGSLGRVAGRRAPERWRHPFTVPQTVRVVFGPQDDAFTEAGRRTLLESSYAVSPSSDRMGCRLEGPAIEHAGAADIISDWIPLGGIQVPGNGKPIILLADRQTTGGYTKIATVAGVDIPKLAQLRPGDGVRFQAVTVEEAQRLHCATERDLAQWDASLTDLGVWGDAGWGAEFC